MSYLENYSSSLLNTYVFGLQGNEGTFLIFSIAFPIW